MKTHNIISAVCFIVLSFSSVQASMVDDAQANFAKGEYLAGMNILTKATNASDQAERAGALLAYGRFYENLVGNVDYAMTFYTDILRTNLPENDPVKTAALAEISKIKLLRMKFTTEDNFLKKLKPAESATESERAEHVQQLFSIVEKKPDYYKISEVYYQLGRYYFAVDELRAAHTSLKKSLALKPAVNFYLPVNVWIDASYYKLMRVCTHNAAWSILGGLLIVTAVVFYVSRPWRWLRFRHVFAGVLMFALWVAVFVVSYVVFVKNQHVSEPTLLNANAAPPYFLNFGTGSTYWWIVKSLFFYGLVGTGGLYVFLLATSRMKLRRTAMLINVVFALLLFSSLSAIYYLRTCDQKSLFASDGKDGIAYYAKGGNYFITYGMEPYILTDPKAYPNLSLNNVSDPYIRDWILKYTPFTSPTHD